MIEKINYLVLNALKEIKEENDLDFEITDNTKILGQSGVMDSVDFVSFIMLLEEKLLDEHDIEISILSEKAFSRNHSPFQDVEHLSNYIAEEVK